MPTDPTWTDQDAVALRQFLTTNPNFTRKLRTYKHTKEGAQTMEAAALRGARRDGADDILDGIGKMAGMNEATEESPYIGDK
jgi:hypothetical protein